MDKPVIKSKFFGKLDQESKRKWKRIYKSAYESFVSEGQSKGDASCAAAKKADGAVKSVKDKAFIPFGLLSFSDVEAYFESSEKAAKLSDLIETFQFLVENIVVDGGDSATIAALLKAASQDFAKKVDEILTESEMSEKETDESAASSTNFIFKDAEGRWRFLGTYSNNFIDRHEEILSADSHKEFVAAVKSGAAPYPFLYFWHSLKMGQSDFIDYDEPTGMAVVGGYFFDDYVAIAEALMKSAKSPLGMSHGMPKAQIEQSGNIITKYRSFEVSLLPREKAANLLTNFEYYEGNTMSDLASKLKQALQLPDEVIDRFVKQVENQSAAAVAAGLQRKEEGTDAASEETDAVTSAGNASEENVSDKGADKSPNDAAAPPQDLVSIKSLQDLADEIKAEFVKLKGLIPDVEPILKRLQDAEAILGAIVQSPQATMRELSHKAVSVAGWDIATDGGVRQKEGYKPEGPTPDKDDSLFGGGNPLSGL